jgi:hypothetical protein
MIRVETPPAATLWTFGWRSETVEEGGEVDPTEQLVPVSLARRPGPIVPPGHSGTPESSGFETATEAKRIEAASSSASTT